MECTFNGVKLWQIFKNKNGVIFVHRFVTGEEGPSHDWLLAVIVIPAAERFLS